MKQFLKQYHLLFYQVSTYVGNVANSYNKLKKDLLYIHICMMLIKALRYEISTYAITEDDYVLCSMWKP